MMQQTAQLQKPKEKQLQKPAQEQKEKSGTEKKAIIFDAGALISFSMNGITKMIKDLKGVFSGKFIITEEVKKEIIDTPIKIKRFQLEALKIKDLFDEKILELPSSLGIKDSEIQQKTEEFLDIANSTFNGDGKDLKIMDKGEASCLALSKILNKKGIKNIIAIDERTTRVLAENPENLKKFLEKKMHVKISADKKKFEHFTDYKVIRSPELIYIAYKKGLVKLKSEKALDSLLHAMKFKGASISNGEIEEIKRIAGV